MIQTLGIIEVLLFYTAYYIKLISQKKRGIITNQLGQGNKSRKTIIIELLLRMMSSFIAALMLVSAILNTSWFNSIIIRIIGLFVFALGIFFFIAAMLTMKDSWRAGIPAEDKTKMISSGIFRYSRNPAFYDLILHT